MLRLRQRESQQLSAGSVARVPLLALAVLLSTSFNQGTHPASGALVDPDAALHDDSVFLEDDGYGGVHDWEDAVVEYTPSGELVVLKSRSDARADANETGEPPAAREEHFASSLDDFWGSQRWQHEFADGLQQPLAPSGKGTCKGANKAWDPFVRDAHSEPKSHQGHKTRLQLRRLLQDLTEDAADDPESSSFDDLVPGDLDHHDQSAKSGSREQLSEECSHEVRKQLRQVHSGKDLTLDCRKYHRKAIRSATAGEGLSSSCRAELHQVSAHTSKHHSAAAPGSDQEPASNSAPTFRDQLRGLLTYECKHAFRNAMEQAWAGESLRKECRDKLAEIAKRAESGDDLSHACQRQMRRIKFIERTIELHINQGQNPMPYEMIDGNPRTQYRWFNKNLYDMCKSVKAGKGGAMVDAEMKPELLALRDCLNATNHGLSCANMDRTDLQRAASALPGVRQLLNVPACLSVAKSPDECNTWEGNEETEFQNIRTGNNISNNFKRPDKDIRQKQWKTCALVGRSPIIKLSKSGHGIDQHDAVWRFNLDTPQSSQGWVGTNTNVRVLSHLDASKSAGLEHKRNASEWHKGEHEHWKKHTLGSTRKTHQPEDWVMWDVHSNKLLDDMARIYKPNTMRMVSSEFISWVLKIYFNIMGDLEHIGLGPFDCAEVNSLSTGMHAVFMAHLSCEIVNLYGMSYAGYLVYRRSAHTDGAHYEWVPHEHHAWEFDGFLIRLLHIAGKVSVCNRDDPTVSTIELMKIK